MFCKDVALPNNTCKVRKKNKNKDRLMWCIIVTYTRQITSCEKQPNDLLQYFCNSRASISSDSFNSLGIKYGNYLIRRFIAETDISFLRLKDAGLIYFFQFQLDRAGI